MSKEVEVTPAEESGGIVTTVKTEVSSDLDLKRMMKEQAGEEEDDDTGEKEEKVEAKSVRSDKDQKEINRLNKEIRLARRGSTELADKVARLEALIEKPAETREEKPVRSVDNKRPVRPKLNAENFKNEAEFEAAQAEAESQYEDDIYQWRKNQEFQQSAAERQRRQDAEVVNAFNEKVVDFVKDHEDYTEVMDSELRLSPIMFGAVMEEGPALGYYFATHVEEAEKIATMDPKAQTKAITRIIVKLEDSVPDKKESTEKSKTKVDAVKPPEPPKPNPGRGAAPAKDKSQMSFREREAEYAKRNPGKLNYL